MKNFVATGTRLVLSALSLLLLLLGCNNYEGDGEMTYAGPFAATEQWVLQLGEIEPGSKTYRLNGLPAERFTVGLVMHASEEALQRCGPEQVTQTVTLVLSADDGAIVIDESASLADWVWSHSRHECGAHNFIYRRGMKGKVPLDGGAFTHEELGVKAYEGWGTYFTASPGTEYEIKLTLEEEFPAGITATLVAKGGGWK